MAGSRRWSGQLEIRPRPRRPIPGQAGAGSHEAENGRVECANSQFTATSPACGVVDPLASGTGAPGSRIATRSPILPRDLDFSHALLQSAEDRGSADRSPSGRPGSGCNCRLGPHLTMPVGLQEQVSPLCWRPLVALLASHSRRSTAFRRIGLRHFQDCRQPRRDGTMHSPVLPVLGPIVGRLQRAQHHVNVGTRCARPTASATAELPSKSPFCSTDAHHAPGTVRGPPATGGVVRSTLAVSAPERNCRHRLLGPALGLVSEGRALFLQRPRRG